MSAKKTVRACAECGRRFQPDPRVLKRQRYCRRETCVIASRSAAQRRWSRKNKSHFTGWENGFRVREWRSGNPGYWRRKKRIGRYEIRGDLARVVGECALQDLIDVRFSLVVGLVSHLIKSPLQDEIAREIRRLMLLGHGILTQTAAATPRKKQG